MKWRKSLELLQVHCQGEVGKVIVGGAPEIPGATMLDKMNHINEVDDSLRRFVVFEPRAHVAMSVNLLTPPCRPDAHAGFIVLQADRADPMSGSNCICVVTALLESGRIPVREPETIVRLDTPAGLVVARARCDGGRCRSVSLDNVPCFVEALDQAVETVRWGRIKADIAFGGVYYGIVDVDQIGLAIVPKTPGISPPRASRSRRRWPRRFRSGTLGSPRSTKSPMSCSAPGMPTAPCTPARR